MLTVRVSSLEFFLRESKRLEWLFLSHTHSFLPYSPFYSLHLSLFSLSPSTIDVYIYLKPSKATTTRGTNPDIN